jgi:pimeloyl-ACP methyl ester carboxylesterase
LAVVAVWSFTPLMVPLTGSSVLPGATMSSSQMLSARLAQTREMVWALPIESNTWMLVGGSGGVGLTSELAGRLPTNWISLVGVGSSMTWLIWIGARFDVSAIRSRSTVHRSGNSRRC